MNNNKNDIKSVITLIFDKSDRKNTKGGSKRFYFYNDYKLKINIIYDMIETFIKYNKIYKNGFSRNFYIILEGNKTRLKTEKRYSIEQYINDLFEIIQYASGQTFDISLKELHNDSNIRFLINEYYKKEGVK